MGKVVLKLQKHSAKAKDGVASTGEAGGGAVADVTVSSSVEMSLPSTKGELYENQPAHGQNPRFAVEKTVATLISPQTEADAGDSKIAIINPSGFTGTSVLVHVVVKKDPNNPSNDYGEPFAQIVNAGSGYASLPTIKVKDRSGTWHSCTVTMGSGSFVESDFERILLFENGTAHNHDGTEFITKSRAKFKDALDSNTDTDFFTGYLEAGKAAQDVVSIKPMNIYNHNIKLADLGVIQMATFIGSDKALDMISDEKKALQQYNESLQHLDAAYNAKIDQDYETLKQTLDQKELDEYHEALSTFQENYAVDLGRAFSPRVRSGPAVDAVWTTAMLLVSNYAKRMGARFASSGPNLSRLQTWLAASPRNTTIENSGFPAHPPQATYPPKPGYRQSQAVSTPKELDYMEGVAKFFYWKTICMAAIGTIGGIFSRIMSSKSGVSSYKRSGGNVRHTARIWMPQDTDGMVVSWLKAEFRRHDLISVLRNILDALIILPSSVKSLAGSIFPDNSTEAKRMQILLLEAHCAANIETLKTVYKNLNQFRLAAHNHLGHLKTKGAFGTRNTEADINARETISYLDYTLGKIALSFDAYAILSEKENAKNVKINLDERLYWLEIYPKTVTKPSNRLLPAKAPRRFEFSDKLKYVVGSGKTISNFKFAYDQNLADSVSNPTRMGEDFEVYGLFGKNDGFKKPNFSLKFDSDGELEKITVVDQGSGLGGIMLLRPKLDYWDKTGLTGTVGNTSVYYTDWKPEPVPNASEAKSERNNRTTFSYTLNEASDTELDNLLENYTELSNFINTHGVAPVTHFLNGRPTKGNSSFDANWTGAVSTLVNIENIIKSLSNSPDHSSQELKRLAEGMQVVSIVQPELGRCEDEEIQIWDKTHAKIFYDSPGAYNSTRKKAIIQESICKKASCGVAQVYVTPPSIGEKVKEEIQSNVPTVVADGVDTGPICGNATLKYNLHPTVDLRIIGQQRNFSLFTDSQTIAQELRISSSARQASELNKATFPFNRIRYGADGDISMPAVFGNWAFSFNNVKENDQRGGLTKLVNFILSAAQLSNNKVDPRITASITPSMKSLLEHYQGYRLYGQEYTTRLVAGQSDAAAITAYKDVPASRLAPIKSASSWDKGDAINYYHSHKDSLKEAYNDVAQATGKYAWDKKLLNSMDITPVLTSEQKFSGVCYPVFQSFGYTFKPYRTTLGMQGISLGAWGPTTNDKQQEEEMFIGRTADKSANNKPIEDGSSLIVSNASHLPIGVLPLNSAGTQDTTSTTEAGIRANKKLYIPDVPFMQELFKQGMNELKDYSTWIPRFEVRDISPQFKIRASGLPVGNEAFTLTSANIQGKTLEQIEAACMNVTDYENEASSAYSLGYWRPPANFAEPWDSRNLKKKYNIPYYDLNSANGKSYISGQTGDGEAAAIANLTTAVNTYHEWVNNRHYTGAALVKNGARITSDTIHYATGNDDYSLSEAQDNAFATLASNLGSAWTTALAKTDEDGDKLAVSGVHSTDTIISSYTHNIATHDGTWSPVTPTKYAENLPALKITGGGGTSNLATATADYINKLRGKPNGSVRTAPLCGDGDTGQDARPNPTHLSSGLVPFQTSYNYTSATSCADAFAALKVLVEADSTTYYNTYGEGLAAGPTNFLTLTSSGCSGIGAPTIHSNPLSTGWSTAGTLADAKNGDSNTNSWYARLSCSAGTLGTGDGSQIAELGMSGSASVDWPTQFSATGSTSSQAWARTKIQQVDVDNHQFSYWTTALSKTNADIELVGGTPPVPGNFTLFQTGAPVFTSGTTTTSLLYSPYDQNAAYEGYSEASSAQDWISNIFYTSAYNNVNSNNLCTIDTTDSVCGASVISNPSLDDIWGMHWQSGSHSTQAQCNAGVLDTNASTYTNYLIAVSGVRRYMYDVIRKRLQEGSQHNAWSGNTLEASIYTDQSFNQYNFSDIGSTLAVYPNSGALCDLDSSSTDIDFESDCPNPNWLGNQSASSADTNISTTSETRVRQIVNLKDWAPTGDIDIWILESTKHFAEGVYSGECYNHGTSNHYDGWVSRYLNEYHYRTAIFGPTDTNNISGSFNSDAPFTATAPVINRTRFVKGTGVCSSYSQFRATGDASVPNFITGEARCENWNVNTKRAVVTGRIDSAVSVAITPLARNEYDGTIVVSGEIPVVTGTCDWSATKRAVFIEEGEDAGTKLKRHELSGYVDQSEAYILKYQNNYSGVYNESAKNKNTVKSNNNPKNGIENTSEQEAINLKTEVDAGDIYKRSDSFLVEAANPEKADVPTYLVAGWPRINQAASPQQITSLTSKSSFARTVLVTVDDKDARQVLSRLKTNSKQASRAFGSININSVIIDKSSVIQKQLDLKINNTNLKSRKMGTLTLTKEKAVQGQFSYNVDVQADDFRSNVKIVSPEELDQTTSTFPIQIIENEAAACQSCVTTEVTTSDMQSTENQKVIYMNENYIHGMQVDWELRSGNWNFTVPYVEAGKEIIITDKNGEQQKYQAQQWYDMVTDSFTQESADKYINHYTLFGIPFAETDTQLTCNLKDYKSQLDKIYDYQIELNQKGATYRHLKEAGKHEIKFKT